MSVLFGRDEDLGDLAGHRGKVVLVLGDTGIGKSSVLEAVQKQEGAALAPEPVGLRNAPGALQRGLLDSLGAALAEATKDQSAVRRVGDLVVKAVGRVADAQLKDLAAGVGRQLLGLVRTRISPELADLIDEFAHQLVTASDDELAARINNAADQDVVDLVVTFASEILDVAEARRLCLALDNGDRLDEADRRRLADLAELLPDGVVLRVAFSTWSARKRAEADDLCLRGAEAVELVGIDRDAIGAWLASEGLPSELADEVHRATSGFALDVASAIGLLREAGTTYSLSELAQGSAVRKMTEISWRELDPFAQVAAAKLAAFADPLSADEAELYLGIDLTAWRTLERSLVDSRIFTGRPSWFHELRRRHIWHSILSQDERDAALEQATEHLSQQLALPGADSAALVQYALLVGQQSSRLAGDSQLAAATTADLDEVAIAASLMELSQPTPAPLLADSVFAYARQVFRAGGDLVAALQRLKDKGFVYLASNDWATVIAPVWTREDVIRVLAGRAGAELGRIPTPQLATAIFEAALRPRLGAFRNGFYGIGTPRISELSQRAAQMQRIQSDGSIVIGRNGPNLLLRMCYGAVPLYASLVYDNDAERNRVVDALADLDIDILEHHLMVVDDLRHPMRCVTSLRFLKAAELLTGHSLSNPVSGPPSRAPALQVAIPLDEEMRQRAATLDAVRALCDAEELFAYGLERPIGYVYRGDVSEYEAAHVLGRTGATRLDGTPTLSDTRGFYRERFSSLANLGNDEHATLISWRHGAQQPHPIVDELIWLFKQAAAFNQTQDRVRMSLNSHQLEDAISVATARAVADAARLKEACELEVSEEDLRSRGFYGTSISGLLYMDTPDPHYVPAAHATLLLTSEANDSGDFRASIRIVPASQASGTGRTDMQADFRTHFGIDLTKVGRHTYGDARYILSEWLGYRENDLWFTYSDEAAGA